jgi:hypothetical protein
MNDFDWMGHYLPLERDSSIPDIEEFNWHNREMREPFHHTVEAIRRYSKTRQPLKKWQIRQIVDNNDFDNFYDFVRLIEKAHGITEEEWR